jgi:ABC-type uncharacterized transport system permease subunit
VQLPMVSGMVPVKLLFLTSLQKGDFTLMINYIITYSANIFVKMGMKNRQNIKKNQ